MRRQNEFGEISSEQIGMGEQKNTFIPQPLFNYLSLSSLLFLNPRQINPILVDMKYLFPYFLLRS